MVYCMKCKGETGELKGSEYQVEARNGALMMKSQCSKCKCTKCQIISGGKIKSGLGPRKMRKGTVKKQRDSRKRMIELLLEKVKEEEQLIQKGIPLRQKQPFAFKKREPVSKLEARRQRFGDPSLVISTISPENLKKQKQEEIEVEKSLTKKGKGVIDFLKRHKGKALDAAKFLCEHKDKIGKVLKPLSKMIEAEEEEEDVLKGSGVYYKKKCSC